MRRTRLLMPLLALLTVICLPLSAQLVSDIHDRLYVDLDIWQARGYIAGLPPLQPYPMQLVRTLLEQVGDSGDAEARRLATEYLKELGGLINPHIGLSGRLRTDLSGVYQEYRLMAAFQGELTPTITYSGSLGGVASSDSVDSLLPEYTRPDTDVVYDAAVAPLGSTGLIPRVSSDGEASFGTDHLYLQAGITRTSFGPFGDDSIVLSSTAPQAGRVAFTIHEDLYTYTSLFMDIAATSYDGSGGPRPDKYLSLHSLEVHPFDWLSLGMIESVVWGGRFEPLYLLPFPAVLFFAQGMTGYGDNSLLGVTAGLHLPESVRFDFMLYVDDAAFNDLIKLNLNTMLVLSAQAGVSWTPHIPFLARLSMEYTLITPYMYSHVDSNGAGLNYQNYTNNGENMATSLQPDSDRIELKALLRPLSFLELSPYIRFIRHGNGSEGIEGGGDGTIFDDGYVNGIATFTPAGGYPNPPGGLWTRFLTQDVIEKTLQAGLGVSARFATPAGQVSASLGYTFEYCWNHDLAADSNRLASHMSMGAGYAY
jgi:hypothetical protein